MAALKAMECFVPIINDKLAKARDFESKCLGLLRNSELPRFHVTGGTGWINDPNGFSVYKGEYHLFFQYHPYSVNWGPMHWGHVKTTDFIHWERLPIALAPKETYDKDGCFSGSAIEMPSGKHLLMYTGVRNMRKHNGALECFQTQCIALGDGTNYCKYEGNPILDETSLPPGFSPYDFRDPKIIKEGDIYYALVGNRAEDGSGSILMFESHDAMHWEFFSVLESCNNQFGKMWECPDFFNLDGQDTLLISAQEMSSIGLEFHPGNISMCFFGKYNPESRKFVRKNVQAIDFGLDFYAPQTLETEDGRRIMIAWMQSWESSGCKPKGMNFFGQMTLPRELHVRNGRLIQLPVREIERYRTSRTAYKNITLSEEINLHGIKGRFIDMTVTVRPVNKDRMYRYFRINVARDGEHVTIIRHKPENNTIRVDRSHSGFPHDIINMRDFPVTPNPDGIKLRIIMDRYSIELFVNDGEQAASFVIYTPLSADSISFEPDGSVILDVEKFDLEV